MKDEATRTEKHGNTDRTRQSVIFFTFNSRVEERRFYFLVRCNKLGIMPRDIHGEICRFIY